MTKRMLSSNKQSTAKADFVLACAFLAAIALLLGLLGPLSGLSTRLVASCLLLLFVFLAPSFSKDKGRLLLFALLVIAAFSFMTQDGRDLKLWASALLCLLLGRQAQREDAVTAPLFNALGLTAFVFGVLYESIMLEPMLWAILQKSALLLSVTIGALSKQPLLLSATASGLLITLLFTLFGLFVYALSTSRSAKRLLISSATLFAMNFLFIAGVHLLALVVQRPWSGEGGHAQAGHHHHEWPFADVSPMHLPVVLFVSHLLLLYFFLKKTSWASVQWSWRPSRWQWAITGSACFLFGLGVLFWPRSTASLHSQNILLYDKGFLNWQKPEHGSYGLRASGMFGMLPDYLEALGYRVRKDSVLSAAALQETDVLVAINLSRNLSPEDKQIVETFVQAGGGLLVLGDHTGLGGIMEPLNDLLAFVKIRFRFDSAHYLTEDWRDAFAFFPSPLFAHVRDEQDLGISVGASLDFSPLSAQPVLFARYGYSDWGNAWNAQNAYLGDRLYNPGELLGDLVLIAGAEYGRGRVLVFGDTSTFQNGVLPHSLNFVSNVFEHLTEPSPGWMKTSRRYLGLLALFIGLAMLFLFARALREPAVIMWLALACAAFFAIATTLNNKPVAIKAATTPIAYIDASHLNRFTQYEDDGIWALLYNLMRNEYLPVVQRDFSTQTLAQSKLAFFIAPAKALTQSEIAALENYIHRGGTVIWSVGYEEKTGSINVLARFGFNLDNVPLGPIPAKETSADIQFYEAWPALAKRDEATDTLCTGWNYPVIVSRKLGQGKFILLADSGFLLSENIEGEEKYSEANIAFLRKWLAEL